MEVDETATKPEDSAPAPADPNGTAMKGPGSDNFGLSSRVGKDFLGVNGTAKKSYGRWDWYAAKVQRNLREAMQGHRKTRSANFVVEMQIWPDSSGRIEKVKLLRSTGDATLDAALRTEVFPGLQLEEPPPAGMKLPINLRLSAKRTT
jgi:outer membrane biosynthesis protein TonB